MRGDPPEVHAVCSRISLQEHNGQEERAEKEGEKMGMPPFPLTENHQTKNEIGKPVDCLLVADPM